MLSSLRRRALLALAATGISLVAAGCGGSHGSAFMPAHSGMGGMASGSAPAAGSGSSATCPSSADLPTGTADHGSMAATGTTVHVEAGDDYFAPTCVLRVTANSTVTLVVHNGGQMFHNVAVPSQRISTDVPPGKTITVHVHVGTAPVVYYCTYHQAAGMYGSLVPAT